jgi:hypothetical protein
MCLMDSHQRFASFSGDGHKRRPAVARDAENVEDIEHIGLVYDLSVFQLGNVISRPADEAGQPVLVHVVLNAQSAQFHP